MRGLKLTLLAAAGSCFMIAGPAEERDGGGHVTEGKRGSHGTNAGGAIDGVRTGHRQLGAEGHLVEGLWGPGSTRAGTAAVRSDTLRSGRKDSPRLFPDRLPHFLVYRRRQTPD